jgi:hypothetical protein
MFQVPQARSVCLSLGFGCPRFDFLPGSWVRVPQVRFFTWVLGSGAPGTECVPGSWVRVPQVRFFTWVLGFFSPHAAGLRALRASALSLSFSLSVLFVPHSSLVRPSRLRIPSKRPPHPHRRIHPIRPGRLQIRRTQVTSIPPQVIHLMLRHPQLQSMRHLKSHPDRAVICNWLHRSLVAHLRYIVSKRHLRLKKQKYPPPKRSPEWLELDIPAHKIPRIRRATRARSPGAQWLRIRTAPQVRLVVAGRHLKVRVAPYPIVWEEESRLCNR